MGEPHSTPPLDEAEIEALRRIIEAEAHATWLRKQLKVFVPIAFAAVTALYATIDWIVKHVRWA